MPFVYLKRIFRFFFICVWDILRNYVHCKLDFMGFTRRQVIWRNHLQSRLLNILYSCRTPGSASEATDFPLYFNSHSRYTNNIDEYETVIPHRISSEGNLLSYFIPENYDRNVVANERRRRESTQDGTIYYGLKYQDQYFKLVLSPNVDFISPGLVVEYKSDKPRMKRASNTQCHYRGYVLGEEDSSASLSVCNGMAGYVRINKDMFFIEPADGFEPQSDGKHVHLIYKRSGPQLEETLGRCTSGDDWQMSWAERLREEITHNPGYLATLEKYKTKKGKHHHSGEESLVRHLEAAIVCDKKFVQFYKGQDMDTYVLTIMNMVAGLYHDASIGNLINFVVVRVIYLEKEEKEIDLKLSTDAEKSLSSFCDWQVRVNPKEDSHPNHHDVAVLVTKYDICSNPEDCNLLGLANVAEVCNPGRSCCINEDNGLKLAITVAHEVGHVLSCGHDTGEGSDCKPEAPEGWGYVMAPFIGSYTIQWSNCSRQFITEFLELGLGECLLDEPTEHHWDFPDMLPGAVYGPDDQCRMQFHKDYPLCDRGPDINCEALWCTVAGRGCTSYGIAPLEGTKCANNMWCFRKKCVPAGQRPNATAGGWGPWSRISRCSRTCGGGVQSQERECNNPPPANRGKYCVGKRKRHFICNKTPCKPESLSFREQQCQDYNKVQVYGGYHNWTSLTRKDLNPCALYCMDETRTGAKLSPRAKDGTPCKLGTKNRCIAGVCREVGCDWKLDSGAQNDMCLECEGNGVNCEKVEKTFTEKKGNGYVTMFKVPVDSRNVKVIELGSSINTIAVSDVNKKTFYLNGKYAEFKDGEYNFGPGIKGVYVHPQRDREELLIMGPTTNELLVHYVFFRGGTNPGVKLEYYKKINSAYQPKYSWELLDWEECSALCDGGTQVSRPKCVEEKIGKVPDKFCAKIHKPKTRSRICNRRACKIKWKVTHWSKCKMGTDGNTYKTRKIKCVRKAAKKGGSDVILDNEKCGKKIPTEHKCIMESAQRKGPSLNIDNDREYFLDYDETVDDDSRVFAKPLEYSYSDTLYNKMEDLSHLSNLQTEEKQSSFKDTKLTSGAEERRKKYPFGRIGKYENPTPRTVVDVVPPVVYKEAPYTERILKLNEETLQDIGDKIPEDHDTVVLDTSKTKTYTGQEALKKLYSTRNNKTFSVTEN